MKKLAALFQAIAAFFRRNPALADAALKAVRAVAIATPPVWDDMALDYFINKFGLTPLANADQLRLQAATNIVRQQFPDLSTTAIQTAIQGQLAKEKGLLDDLQG